MRPIPLAWLSFLIVGAASACRLSAPMLDDIEQDPVVPPAAFELRAGKPVADLPGERRFRNVRQLTFGGENVDASWSFDGTKLILQSTRPPFTCEQVFTLDLVTGEEQLVSTGEGRATRGDFLHGDDRIVFASTHLTGEDRPPAASRIDGRDVRAIDAGFDLFTAKPDGSDLRRITDTAGYDAEATACPVSGRLVFTSMRDGDLELYSMEPNGSDVQRLTNRVGVDGGAFYSHDGSKLVQSSGDPATAEKGTASRDVSAATRSRTDITVLDREGANPRRITNNGAANLAPFWHPDNERIVFSSNQDDARGRNFELYLVREDGTNLERLTFHEAFDGSPTFSPCGRYIAFTSDRFGGAERGETNVFVAEWVDDVE